MGNDAAKSTYRGPVATVPHLLIACASQAFVQVAGDHRNDCTGRVPMRQGSPWRQREGTRAESRPVVRAIPADHPRYRLGASARLRLALHDEQHVPARDLGLDQRKAGAAIEGRNSSQCWGNNGGSGVYAVNTRPAASASGREHRENGLDHSRLLARSYAARRTRGRRHGPAPGTRSSSRSCGR